MVVVKMHPEDEDDLYDLRLRLAGLRTISRRTLADLGKAVFVSDKVFGECERGRQGSLTMHNVQLWAKSLGLTLNYKFHGVEMPYPTKETTTLDAMIAQGGGNVDAWDRQLFVAILRQLRIQRKHPSALLGQALGITGKSVVKWELTATDFELARAYAYVREIGGRVKFSAN
jgi:hypothetical protein